MKIGTEFDHRLKRIYEVIALSYPPRTIGTNDASDDIQIEELVIDIKPFAPKVKSFNINKDVVTCHKATKQLSKFLETLERKRRSNDLSEAQHPEDYIKYKENVVSFINTIASKAKAKQAQKDSLQYAQLKEKKAVVIQDLLRFSNALQADEGEMIEQRRRVEECHDVKGRRGTMSLVTQITPVHEQLQAAYALSDGSVQGILKRASQDEFGSVASSESGFNRERAVEVNAKLKNIFNSAEYADESKAITSIVEGSGNIGRTLKRGNKKFQETIHQVSESSRKKSVVQSELLGSLAKVDGKLHQRRGLEERENKARMSVVLDTMVRKVAGRNVEKDIEKDRQQNELKEVQRDTFEKIKDYGIRKESKTDMEGMANNKRMAKLNSQNKCTPGGKERRPTGALKHLNAANRKESAPVTSSPNSTRKKSTISPSTQRKGSGKEGSSPRPTWR